MKLVFAITSPVHWQPQAEEFARAAHRQGHAALVATPHDLTPLTSAPCDVLICLSTGESLTPFLQAAPTAHKVLYLIKSVPTPTESSLGSLRADLHAFHHVFVHARRSLPTLRALGHPRAEELIWPHFPTIFHPLPGVTRDIDVLFLGERSKHRESILEPIARRFRVQVSQKAFHDQATSLYARARIAINVHYTPQPAFEYRVVEALGCGAFLLTEPLDTEDVFLDGKHLAVIKPDQLLQQVESYLGNAAERERIAHEGHARVQTLSIDRQVGRILEVASTRVPRARPVGSAVRVPAASAVAPTRVNIIRHNNAAGLARSGGLLADILRVAGFHVTLHDPYQDLPPGLEPASNLAFQLDAGPQAGGHAFDVNLFLEQVFPAWFPAARVNCLVPNQEWFAPKWLPHLSRFDHVLCKTREAERIFRDRGCSTEFVSFTSQDRLDATCRKDHPTFFHLAGKSKQKGTEVLLDLWLRHPEWPRLRLVQRADTARVVTAGNIEHVTGFVSEELLRRFQNESSVHLCPSEAEGFGHSLAEGMSCGAVVLTTDGPPMNELVRPDRGVLVAYKRATRQGLGAAYHVDPAALEHCIEEVLRMDEATRTKLGDRARAWFLANDAFFRRRVVESVAALVRA